MGAGAAVIGALILSMDRTESSRINSRFLPPSCSYADVNPMLDGRYRVVLPDPGEDERGVGTEYGADIIFSFS